MTQPLIGPVHVFMAQGELARQLREAKLAGWRAAVDAALSKIPGGDICDPQTVADDIRTIPEPEEM